MTRVFAKRVEAPQPDDEDYPTASGVDVGWIVVAAIATSCG